MKNLSFQNLHLRAVLGYPRKPGLVYDKIGNSPESIGVKKTCIFIFFELLKIKMWEVILGHPVLVVKLLYHRTDFSKSASNSCFALP